MATLIQLAFEIGLWVHTDEDPWNERPETDDAAESIMCDTNTVIF